MRWPVSGSTHVLGGAVVLGGAALSKVAASSSSILKTLGIIRIQGDDRFDHCRSERDRGARLSGAPENAESGGWREPDSSEEFFAGQRNARAARRPSALA